LRLGRRSSRTREVSPGDGRDKEDGCFCDLRESRFFFLPRLAGAAAGVEPTSPAAGLCIRGRVRRSSRERRERRRLKQTSEESGARFTALRRRHRRTSRIQSSSPETAGLPRLLRPAHCRSAV
ncbi:HEAT repeat-containing protein, partial [Toxoplasma gondii ARI]